MCVKECTCRMYTGIKEPTCYLYMHEHFLKRFTRNWLPSGESSCLLGLQGDTLHTSWILNHVNGLPIKKNKLKKFYEFQLKMEDQTQAAAKLLLPQVQAILLDHRRWVPRGQGRWQQTGRACGGLPCGPRGRRKAWGAGLGSVSGRASGLRSEAWLP